MNRLLQVIAGSSLCAFALVGTAGAASAGEITGNGTLKGANGASECSFSGLNDGRFDDVVGDDERVQSYGQIVRTGAFKGTPVHGVPGTACNPNTPMLPEPPA